MADGKVHAAVFCKIRLILGGDGNRRKGWQPPKVEGGKTEEGIRKNALHPAPRRAGAVIFFVRGKGGKKGFVLPSAQLDDLSVIYFQKHHQLNFTTVFVAHQDGGHLCENCYKILFTTG